MSYRDVLAGMTDAALSERERRHILIRQGGRCFYCDQRLEFGVKWDHFIPRNAKGPHHINNRVAACTPCDGKKGGRMPTQAEIDKFADQLRIPTPCDL